MATIKQRRFTQGILENLNADKPASMSSIAARSGYGKMSKQPGNIMKSKGVIQLFEKAGISAETLAIEWNKVLKAPMKEENISWDAKIKGLTALNKVIIDNPDNKVSAQQIFIDKFLNLKVLNQLKAEIPAITEPLENGSIPENN